MNGNESYILSDEIAGPGSYIKETGFLFVKLLAHRAGRPGKELFNYIVPLDPAYMAGLTGALPVKLSLQEVSVYVI